MSSSNPFKTPASASGISWDEHKGRLFLIEPKDFERGIATSYGEKDAVRADVTIVDAPDEPHVFTEALIFPGVLISQTRPLIGEKVLGRLGQGAAKQGQKPPWRLDDATEADEKQATAYLEQRTSSATTTPAAADDAEPPF